MKKDETVFTIYSHLQDVSHCWECSSTNKSCHVLELSADCLLADTVS